MMYKLFLDDIRYPPDNHYPDEGNDWIIARNMDDAIWCVKNKGIPEWISFDHDLADDHYIIGQKHEKTGYDFAKWFCDYVMDNKKKLPYGFGYTIHSMNPVGAANIDHYMHNFMVHYKKVGQENWS